MRRLTPALLVAAVLAACTGAGLGAWRWAHNADAGPLLPQISAYTRGETVRTGPYLYCNVVNLDDCARIGTAAALSVTERDPVQLSVPAAISRAPWRLLRVYEDESNTTTSTYRPDTTLAVTIPTVDAQRGRVVGVVVQLMTLVQDPQGNLFDLPHAEWSVQLNWEGAAR